jgi:hypothetical protein
MKLTGQRYLIKGLPEAITGSKVPGKINRLKMRNENIKETEKLRKEMLKNKIEYQKVTYKNDN